LSMSEKRNQKRSRKRKKILSVAGDLFWQKTYLGTSVEDIAKAAKVNKASIYYYFDNKAALLFEIAKGAMQSLKELAMPVINSDLPAEEKLKKLTLNHIKWVLSNLGVAGVGQREKRHLPPRLYRTYIAMRDDYENIFRMAISEALAQKASSSLDYKLTGLFVLGLITSMLEWYNPSGELSGDELASKACSFIWNALSDSE